MSEQKHTPTPWAADGVIIKTIPKRKNGRWEQIACTDDGGLGWETDCANAAFIVRAVNSHQAMIDALEAYQAFHHRIFCTGYPLEQHGKPISHTDLNEAQWLAEKALKTARGESQ